MKKVLFLSLLTISLVACSNEKNIKVRDVSKMTVEQMQQVVQSLTPEQVKEVGDAVGQCQINKHSEICNKRIKDVIK